MAKKAIRIFNGNKESTYWISWSPNGKTLASGSFENTVRLWAIDAVISSSITPTPSSQAQANTQGAILQARVTGTDDVNLRKDPGGLGTTSNILTKIAPGQIVTIRSNERITLEGGVWLPVSYNGMDGWILSTFLEPIS